MPRDAATALRGLFDCLGLRSAPLLGLESRLTGMESRHGRGDLDEQGTIGRSGDRRAASASRRRVHGAIIRNYCDDCLPLVMGSIFSAFSMGVLLEACGGWISPQAGLTDKSINSVWGSERVASCDGAFIRAGWSVFSGIGLWVGLRCPPGGYMEEQL